MNTQANGPTLVVSRPFPMPRPRTLIYWAVTAPILLETAVGAEWDLARIPLVREIFGRLGYPLYLLTILGIAKVLAVIGLVSPRPRGVKEWAYAGVFFVYAGAASSQYAIGEGGEQFWTPLVFAALTLVSYALWRGSRHDADVRS
jgi:DoxX-like protein